MSNELVNTIITSVVIPVLLALTAFFIKWLNKKTEEITARIKAEEVQTAIWQAKTVIGSVVKEITETFVSGLKGTTEWTEETGRKAKDMALTKVYLILSRATKDLLNIAFGNAYEWLTNYVEYEVSIQKGADNGQNRVP